MSDDYKTGFNAGFILTEHLPDLAQSISTTNSALPWMEGFRNGRQEYYIQEQVKEYAAQEPRTMHTRWITRDVNHDNKPDQIKDRDGDIER